MSNSLESPVGARGKKNGAEESGDDSDIMWASLNFTNSIVGAGLIGMPYAIEKCGFLVGVIMMVVIAYIVRHSAILLIDCGIKMNALDLEVLCGKVMGKYGYFLALGAMFVFAYGAQIAYMVIIGDTLPVVLKCIFPAAEIERNVVIVTVATCIILPLCLLKSIASLSYASGLSIFANIILVIIVCIRGPIAEHERHINEVNGDFELTNSSLFAGIGAMSFTFVCQHNSFLIFRSLKNPTRENWYKVATYAMSFALFICLVMGVAGYLSFFDFTKGNILNDFSIKDGAVNVGRSLLACSMMMTFPMECYVSRHCLLTIVTQSLFDQVTEGPKDAKVKKEVSVSTGESVHSIASSKNQYSRVGEKGAANGTFVLEDDDEMEINLQNPMHSSAGGSGSAHSSDSAHSAVSMGHGGHGPMDTSPGWFTDDWTAVTIILFLWSVVVLIAVLFGDVGFILALTGAVGASLLGYILPALIYFRSYEDDFTAAYLESQSIYTGALGAPLTQAQDGVNRKANNSSDLAIELADASDLPSDLERKRSSSESVSTCCGFESLGVMVRCIGAWKQFYFSFFSGLLGVFLLFFGVYTVLYDYAHGK